jgi:hypothetical protein
MLASREFGFMLTQGTLSLLAQWWFLKSPWCTTVPAVFGTYTMRLGTYTLIALARIGLGKGRLGRALRNVRSQDGYDGSTVNGATVPAK